MTNRSSVLHSFTGNERAHASMLAKRDRDEEWTEDLCPTRVMMTPAACYPLYPISTGQLGEQGRLYADFDRLALNFLAHNILDTLAVGPILDMPGEPRA